MKYAHNGPFSELGSCGIPGHIVKGEVTKISTNVRLNILINLSARFYHTTKNIKAFFLPIFELHKMKITVNTLRSIIFLQAFPNVARTVIALKSQSKSMFWLIQYAHIGLFYEITILVSLDSFLTLSLFGQRVVFVIYVCPSVHLFVPIILVNALNQFMR